VGSFGSQMLTDLTNPNLMRHIICPLLFRVRLPRGVRRSDNRARDVSDNDDFILSPPYCSCIRLLDWSNFVCYGYFPSDPRIGPTEATDDGHRAGTHSMRGGSRQEGITRPYISSQIDTCAQIRHSGATSKFSKCPSAIFLPRLGRRSKVFPRP
jgi:hypothetical protein